MRRRRHQKISPRSVHVGIPKTGRGLKAAEQGKFSPRRGFRHHRRRQQLHGSSPHGLVTAASFSELAKRSSQRSLPTPRQPACFRGWGNRFFSATSASCRCLFARRYRGRRRRAARIAWARFIVARGVHLGVGCHCLSGGSPSNAPGGSPTGCPQLATANRRGCGAVSASCAPVHGPLYFAVPSRARSASSHISSRAHKSVVSNMTARGSFRAQLRSFFIHCWFVGCLTVPRLQMVTGGSSGQLVTHSVSPPSRSPVRQTLLSVGVPTEGRPTRSFRSRQANK